MLSNQFEHALDERVATEIVHLPERDDAAQMIRLIRIAARTAQRTLPGDFDRQQWAIASEHAAAGGQQRAEFDRLARCDGGCTHSDYSGACTRRLQNGDHNRADPSR